MIDKQKFIPSFAVQSSFCSAQPDRLFILDIFSSISHMAPPLTKKRKVSHSLSEGSDADDASFASFQDGEDMEDLQPEEEDFQSVDGDDGTAGLDDQEEDSGAEGDNKGAPQTKMSTAGSKSAKSVSQRTDQKPANGRLGRDDSAVTSGGGAYTSGTFRSNMFKMQVDEMLSHIRPKHGKREAAAEAALHKLKSAIEKTPAREPLPVVDAERSLIKKSKVAIPFPEPRPAHDAKYKLEYAKPAHINVAGSYPLKLSTRTTEILAVDMVVTMPQTLFQEKDYLNHRYFYKRAYYLACVAASLKSSFSADYNFAFDTLHGNPLQPILTVSPTEGLFVHPLSQVSY